MSPYDKAYQSFQSRQAEIAVPAWDDVHKAAFEAGMKFGIEGRFMHVIPGGDRNLCLTRLERLVGLVVWAHSFSPPLVGVVAICLVNAVGRAMLAAADPATDNHDLIVSVHLGNSASCRDRDWLGCWGRRVLVVIETGDISCWHFTSPLFRKLTQSL